MSRRAARAAAPVRLLAEAGVLAVVASGVLLDARSYPASLAEGAPGPAFFPRMLATLLIACAAWLAIRARPREKREEASSSRTGPASGTGPRAAAGGDGAVEPGAGRSRGNVFRDATASPGVRLGLAVGWIAAFLLVWPRLGTVLSVPLLVAGLMWLTGERSRAILVSVPVLFAGFIYVVFMVLLGVPLPAGF